MSTLSVLPRAKSVKRAFTGLVGLPPEPDGTLGPVTQNIPAKTPAFHSTEDLLADVQAQRRAKRGDAARQRRKTKSQQRAKLKEVLKTPVAEILQEARNAESLARWRAEKQARDMSMSRGMYLAGAPSGMGLLESGGYSPDKIEYIDGRHQVEESELGAREDTSAGFDRDTVGSRRRVKPEGFGAVSDEGDAQSRIVREAEKFADHKGSIFQVKLPDGVFQQCVHAAVDDFCVQESREDSTIYICRLCKIETGYERQTHEHFERVHGDKFDLNHDATHGDTISPCVRRAERKESKLTKLGKTERSLHNQQVRERRREQALKEGWAVIKGNKNERHEQERNLAEKQSWDLERETNRMRRVPDERKSATG